MKIGLFLENFGDIEITKDPGSIAKCIAMNNTEVNVFAYRATENAKRGLNVIEIDKTQSESSQFWKETELEVIIFYSWLSLKYTKTLTALKNAGIKVILKLDSDGTLIYPNIPSYLKVFGIYNNLNSKLLYLIRLVEWYLFPKIISKNKIKQIDSAHGLIIETPTAKEILVESLSFWNRKDLIKKIAVIPNPVDINNETNYQKTDMMTCVGRWDDKRKNAEGLAKTLSQLKTSWQINLIGKGSEKLAQKIKEHNKELQIHSTENMPHENVLNLLAKTKILFSPSLSESFGLVAAEALCQGCSLVCGDIPSFRYFADSNKNGTLANDFTSLAFSKAILTDIEKWENGLYNPTETQKKWRDRLNSNTISIQLLNIIQETK